MPATVNPWFRMYTEFAADPKVQTMPEALQRRLVMLFCMNGNGSLTTLSQTEIAFALRISEKSLEETKKIFLDKGFINDRWEIVNWNKRQFSSDCSTERTRRFRNKDETLRERSGNAIEQNRTEQNRTEQKRERNDDDDDPQVLVKAAVAAMHKDHPALCSVMMAEAAAIREMGKNIGQDPKRTVAAWLQTHAQHCGPWKAELERNPRAYIPQLHVWFRDGMYLQNSRDGPAEDDAAKHERLMAERRNRDANRANASQ